MAKTKIGSNAQFTSAGETINHVSDFVYGYSGSVAATNSTTPVNLLDFHTGSKVTLVHLQYVDQSRDTYERIVSVKINSIEIINNRFDGTPDNSINDYRVLIPPFSHIEFGANINGAVSPMYGTLTGHVYA